METSRLNTLLAAATAVCFAAALGASAFAWQYRGRATAAERKLEVRQSLPPAEAARTAPMRPAVPVAPGGSDDLLPQLLELQSALEERDEYIAVLLEDAAARDARRNNGRGNNFQNNFQNNTPDPQRDADMQARRDAFRQRMEQSVENRRDFFDREAAGLSTEMKGTYAAVRSLLDKAEEYRNLMQSGDLTPEERRELGNTMRELQERLNPLLQNVRREELLRLAEDMGHTVAGQRQFADYVERLMEVTAQPPARMGGPGGGGGGFNAGGGGGNRGGGRNTRGGQ